MKLTNELKFALLVTFLVVTLGLGLWAAFDNSLTPVALGWVFVAGLAFLVNLFIRVWVRAIRAEKVARRPKSEPMRTTARARMMDNGRNW